MQALRQSHTPDIEPLIMINELIYVYCISSSPPALASGMETSGLKSLIFDDFNAIIKYVDESEFSEENLKKNIADLQWLETNVREHIETISLIMQSCTVIPFKFGTIFNTEAGLKKFIADYNGSLKNNFHFIEGKEEWAVKIYCDRNMLSAKIDELSGEAADLERQIMASSPGKAFLLKRKKADLIENEMDRFCKTYGQEYFDNFKNLSESTCLNNLLPKEFTGRTDSMILNATFLVSTQNVNDFRGLVDTLRTNGGDSGFFIEASGPWPPFSFISIKENQ